MRSDPDIVLIGEMRENDTIRLGLTCAAMGMLVFGTLHTNNAPKTVDRIIDAGGDRGMCSMEASLERQLLADKITAEEAYMKSNDKNRFRAAYEAERAAAEEAERLAAEAAAAAAAQGQQ
jgi:Tfp pilus assembly pilus retraction ATPase PilT